MSTSTFKTNPVPLATLLRSCESGKMQLPDFQRSWVWAEDRIQSLIASISLAFPVGALMTLASKPHETSAFAYRPVEGTPRGAADIVPEMLLLDGQQRLTSIYQACLRQQVVTTITPKNKQVKRWFYIDIAKAIDPNVDREDAIFSVPEDRKVKENFDKDIVLDLSTPELEHQHGMFPLNQVFDWDTWQDGFYDRWPERKSEFKQFKNDVLENFKSYQVPVIELSSSTTHAAVCLVFEKVNTGGKALDAFELLTAIYAAQGHKLRDDWLGKDGKTGMQHRLVTYGLSAGRKEGVLAKVASTDVLQSIALLYSKARRDKHIASGKAGDAPPVRATRQSLLDLPLSAYLEYRDRVEWGYKRAAKFLLSQRVYRVLDLPYQTQLVPLAAIFAELGEDAEHAGRLKMIGRWFWCGIFGELYGGAVETRFAKDFVEVPNWLDGGPEPTTVKEGVFRGDRLLTLRSRLSAAYKGIHALLMREGAMDFRSGQPYDTTIFFDEDVDIHHIFPKKWCEDAGLDVKQYDNVINKTPLGYRTNRTIGGAAPSKYLERIAEGRMSPRGTVIDPPIEPTSLDLYLASHAIPVAKLRADDFVGFIAERRAALLALVADATGHPVSDVASPPDEGEELSDDLLRDNDLPTET